MGVMVVVLGAWLENPVSIILALVTMSSFAATQGMIYSLIKRIEAGSFFSSRKAWKDTSIASMPTV